MNELIENKLMEHLEQIMLATSKLSGLSLFKQAIQTACKAQRNACAKVYNEVCLHTSIPTVAAVSLIKNAKIERCDYE